MKIETKFNVGDKFYCVHEAMTQDGKIRWTSSMAFTIYKILFDSDKGIQYMTEHSLYIHKEQDCFATEEEAIEEKNKRNWNEEFKEMCEERAEETIEKFEKEWENND